MSEGVTIRYLGPAPLSHLLRQMLEDEGLTPRFVGGPPSESRDADQVAKWVAIFVGGRIVDGTIGRPIDAAVRVAVDAVCRKFRERFPHIRIDIDP